MAITAPAASPRYVGIAAELRERILSQHLGPHTLLPSERELSEQHAVSRMTARQALTLLESEGYVYRRPPRGTFVAEPRVRFRIGSFSQEAGRLGRQATAELLWAKQMPPDPPTQSALGLDEGGLVHAFHRLRLMEGEPIALETTYFPTALTPGILELPAGGSLWALLKDDFGVEVTRSDAVIESMILDEAACTLLRVRTASPGMLLTRRSYVADGRCVEYARDVYRADRAAFEVSAAVSP
jgi:GntR family transcriptional regulator